MNLENIHIPSTPLSEPWTMWVLLFLLLLFVVAIVRQPAMMKNAFHSLFTRLNRSYSDASTDLMNQVLLIVFRAGVLSLLLYVILYSGGNFSFLFYLSIVAVVLLGGAVKWLLTGLTAYIFMLRHGVEESRSTYESIWLLLSMVLYPVLVLMVDFSWIKFGTIVCIILAIVYVTLVLIRLARVFVSRPIVILYIFIYTITLEVLPIGALTLGIKALL